MHSPCTVEFDAAILSSDIFMVPHAIARTERCETGEGPRLELFDHPAAMAMMRFHGAVDDAALSPVTQRIVRQGRVAAQRNVLGRMLSALLCI